MRTWIVTDSRGKQHEVTASTMAYSTNGNVTFYHEGSLNAFCAFTAPVAVVPKEETGRHSAFTAFLEEVTRKFA